MFTERKLDGTNLETTDRSIWEITTKGGHDRTRKGPLFYSLEAAEEYLDSKLVDDQDYEISPRSDRDDLYDVDTAAGRDYIIKDVAVAGLE